MTKGDDETQSGSKFIAYAAAVQDLDDIKAAYLRVKTKFASASHVVCVYRLPGKETPNLQDYSDDGEIGAGRVVLNLLREESLMNIVVFMIRFHGGQNLGPVRFDLIRKVSQSAVKNLRLKVEKMKREEEAQRVQELEERANQPIPTEWANWSEVDLQGNKKKD